MTRKRWLVVAGAVLVLAPVGVVVGKTIADPNEPVTLNVSATGTATVPGGVGTLIAVDKAQLVAQSQGARVWEAPSLSGSDQCTVTQIASDVPVSVSCGIPDGGIDQEVFTFDGARGQDGAYRAVVRVAPTVRTLTLDGDSLKIEDGLAVFSPPAGARLLRATTSDGDKTLDLRPFLSAPPATPASP